MPRIITAYLAVAGTCLLTMAGLNAAADKFPNATGLGALRDYITRRNG